MNKLISSLLLFIFIFGLIPIQAFSQPFPASGEVLGFNKAVFDSYFSKADREINPDRWLSEAKFGINQALHAWEITAVNLYDNPLLFNEAKNSIEAWSNEELEKRFSAWLIWRFFGSSAEKAISDFSALLLDTHRYLTWKLDDEGNIIFDDKTGDPLIIRPGEDGRDFNNDIARWRDEKDAHLKLSLESLELSINRLYPELLAYIPDDLKESLKSVIQNSAEAVISNIKKEFENIAAREESIFTNRRTMDILSLRRKSEDESARIFTEKLIAETEEICARGIEELKIKIEEAAAGTGDLALLGEEWLKQYQEQFERGLKAWEEAEERFFIRRLEWEQDSIILFSEGEKIWLESFNRFQEELNRWELNVKELLESGDKLFSNISENLEKSISDAKIEFALNMQMRLGAGTEKVKAIIDMYLTCASAAFTAKENIIIIQKHYFNDSIKDPSDSDFAEWLDNTINNFLSIGSDYNDSMKYNALLEIKKSYELYISYIDKAIDSRERILENYSELISSGSLIDILSPNASSEDFYLDEYQLALVRAKAIVTYWERKTSVEEAVLLYASDLSAGRMTEYESILAWENAKSEYNDSIIAYENELSKLNAINGELNFQLNILNDIARNLSASEEELSRINNEYSYLLAASIYNINDNTLMLFNEKYKYIQEKYSDIFFKNGTNSIYKDLFFYGSSWEYSKNKENAEYYLDILINGDDNEVLSLSELTENVFNGLEREINLKLRLAAIDMFSSNQDNEYSGADWYFNAKNINETNYDRTYLYAENLRKQLFNDYQNSFNILLEKRLEFELEIFSEFIHLYSQSEPDIFFPYSSNFKLNSIDDILYIYDLLNNFYGLIKSGKDYFSENTTDNYLIDYFISGGSFLEFTSHHLLNYYDEYFLSEGLFQIFNDYYHLSSFGQSEIFQYNIISLNDFFSSYGINEFNGYFPDAEIIFSVLAEKNGDFTENAALFLSELENCFFYLPEWIENEFNSWNKSLIQYLTASMSFNNIKPVKTKEILLLQLAELENKYNEIEIINNYQLNFNIDFISEIKKEENLLLKMLEITVLLENYENNLLAAEDNVHWRQIINDSNINNINPLIESASSWKEGTFIDCLYYLKYYTNRINDAFALYSENNFLYNFGDSDILYKYYVNEYYNIDNQLQSLSLHFNEIIRLGRNLEISKKTMEEAKIESELVFQILKEKENIYVKIKEDYLKEAETFLLIGNKYDNQYKLLKTFYEITETKRFEYEKQDAIRRWASTSYLNNENIYYEQYKNRLINSQISLEVLTNLYEGESTRIYNNPEYDLLYSEYEQSFMRKITVLEILELLNSNNIEIMKTINENYSMYQYYIYNLGNIDKDYADYISPEIENWTLKDIITVKNNQLSFSTDSDLNLSGINIQKAQELDDYFNKSIEKENELYAVSLFEESINGLVQRMSVYFSDEEKMHQWGLAGQYLLSMLINSNQDIDFLKEYYKGMGQLEKDGQLGKLTIKRSILPGTVSLYDVIASSTSNDNIAGIINNLINIISTLGKNAWDRLSAQEKADLEFYLILTLCEGNDYFSGFFEVNLLDMYQNAYNKVEGYYNTARKEAGKWYNPLSFLWREMRDINKNALPRIETVLNETRNNVIKWKEGLTENINNINNYFSAYQNASNEYIKLEGIGNNSRIEWNDIYFTLLSTDNIAYETIEIIKQYWENMQNDYNDYNLNFISVSDALNVLSIWARNKEIESKELLEKYWINIKNEQEKNIDEYNRAVEMFISGMISINELSSITEKAYGNTAVFTKNHLENKYNVLLTDLNSYLNNEKNFLIEYSMLGNELINLTEQILRNRYDAEYTARETEWELMRCDISDKYTEWQKSVITLLETGRKDWNNGFQKMNDAYNQWINNFHNEYIRVSDDWSLAYLAGLEDKEKWLQLASSAANQASLDSFLLLVGTEGERLSRAMDTREPFSIRETIPDTDLILNELLLSSGISNIFNAFNSINNISSTASIAVKRGLGGISAWDSAVIKAAASDLASKTNAEIAGIEARRLADNARLTADEAVKKVYENVDAANKYFHRSIDNMFIMEGLWSRNGNNYVKNIIEGSTLFQPVISKNVQVKGYEYYNIEPIKLKTNLDKNNIAGLDSIVIIALINSIYEEVEEIITEIFGADDEESEQSGGKFGIHIGKGPNLKEELETTKSRNKIFIDEGEGERGRLESDFIYWLIIDEIGSAELGIAPWDKRMWNDAGSAFKSPSLRSVGQIAGSIAAAAVTTVAIPFSAGVSSPIALAAIKIAVTSAVTASVATASTVAFGALDVAFGYKDFNEVAFDVGKTFATNFITGAIGSASQNMQIMKNFGGNIFFDALKTGTQTATTSFVSTSINAITYDSKNGFGWSKDIFKSGMENLAVSTLSSMASTFTIGAFNNLNGANVVERITGFSLENIINQQKLNNLIGSLAGQGVNLAFDRDFTLNLLNTSIFTGGKINSGLLELQFSRNGSTTMSIGTGGANVSIDNLYAAVKGIGVWNINNKIKNYNKESEEDIQVALRAQYGYGDDKALQQLKDILNEDTKIVFVEDEKYFGKTDIIDGQRVIYLTGYHDNMSIAEQMFLAVTLGHEAHRDGYKSGEIDAYGNLETDISNFIELREASIARTEMGDRINQDYEGFYQVFTNLAFESEFLKISKEMGEMTMYDSFLFTNYHYDEDYFFQKTETNGVYQNMPEYYNIPLFYSKTKGEVDEINRQRKEDADNAYYSLVFDNNNDAISDKYLYTNNSLITGIPFTEEKYISLYNYGCMFISIKYMYEGITGRTVETLELHDFIKENGMVRGSNLLSNQLVADILNAYSNDEYHIRLLEDSLPTVQRLYELDQSSSMYMAHLRIRENGTGSGTHSVTLSGINFTYDNENNVTGISSVDVANPWNSSTYIGRTNYSLNQIARWDIYEIIYNGQDW